MYSNMYSNILRISSSSTLPKNKKESTQESHPIYCHNVTERIGSWKNAAGKKAPQMFYYPLESSQQLLELVNWVFPVAPYKWMKSELLLEILIRSYVQKLTYPVTKIFHLCMFSGQPCQFRSMALKTLQWNVPVVVVEKGANHAGMVLYVHIAKAETFIWFHEDFA